MSGLGALSSRMGELDALMAALGTGQGEPEQVVVADVGEKNIEEENTEENSEDEEDSLMARARAIIAAANRLGTFEQQEAPREAARASPRPRIPKRSVAVSQAQAQAQAPVREGKGEGEEGGELFMWIPLRGRCKAAEGICSLYFESPCEDGLAAAGRELLLCGRRYSVADVGELRTSLRLDRAVEAAPEPRDLDAYGKAVASVKCAVADVTPEQRQRARMRGQGVSFSSTPTSWKTSSGWAGPPQGRRGREAAERVAMRAEEQQARAVLAARARKAELEAKAEKLQGDTRRRMRQRTAQRRAKDQRRKEADEIEQEHAGARKRDQQLRVQEAVEATKRRLQKIQIAVSRQAPTDAQPAAPAEAVTAEAATATATATATAAAATAVAARRVKEKQREQVRRRQAAPPPEKRKPRHVHRIDHEALRQESRQRRARFRKIAMRVQNQEHARYARTPSLAAPNEAPCETETQGASETEGTFVSPPKSKLLNLDKAVKIEDHRHEEHQRLTSSYLFP